MIPETKNPKFENEVIPHKNKKIPEFDESGDSLNNTISSVLENLREANHATIEELKAFLTHETQERFICLIIKRKIYLIIFFHQIQ